MRVLRPLGLVLLLAMVTGVMTTRAGAQPARGHLLPVSQSRPGYVITGADGGAFAFGGDAFSGSMSGARLAAPIISASVTADGGGYWELGRDGGVFAFGDAEYEGSGGAYHAYGCGVPGCTPTTALRPAPSAAPAVGIAAFDDTGYIIAHADGSVFSFGDEWGIYSGLSQVHLTAPIVGMALDPFGERQLSSYGSGAWLASSDGGVFALGNAPYLGSLGGLHLDAPIVGIAANPNGSGYWLVASDGGVFAFGGAPFSGSLPGLGVRSSRPIVGMAPGAGGDGYWLVGSDGGVFAFGGAQFEGSAAGSNLAAPAVAVSASNTLSPCGSSVLSTSTDSSPYALGAPVTITIGNRNPSRYACAGLVNFCPLSISVTGPTGQMVWTIEAADAAVGILDQGSCPEPDGPIAAGQSATYSRVWDQDNCAVVDLMPAPNPECPETQVPAGVYTATEAWPTGQVTSATFSISP